jgi:hypothetical protein
MPGKSKVVRAISALRRERRNIVRLLLENPEFGCYSRVGKILVSHYQSAGTGTRNTKTPPSMQLQGIYLMNFQHSSLGNSLKYTELLFGYLKVCCNSTLTNTLSANPYSLLEDVRQDLEEIFEWKVTKPVASRTLQKMGWSWKVPTNFQIAKYNSHNIARYLAYLEWVQSIEDWSTLKFCDESHIVPHKIGNRKVLGLVNQRVYTRDSTLNQASSSITVMTFLDPDQLIPLWVDYREESNNQWDFLEFVLGACECCCSCWSRLC